MKEEEKDLAEATKIVTGSDLDKLNAVPDKNKDGLFSMPPKILNKREQKRLDEVKGKMSKFFKALSIIAKEYDITYMNGQYIHVGQPFTDSTEVGGVMCNGFHAVACDGSSHTIIYSPIKSDATTDKNTKPSEN